MVVVVVVVVVGQDLEVLSRTVVPKKELRIPLRNLLSRYDDINLERKQVTGRHQSFGTSGKWGRAGFVRQSL